MFLLSLCPVLLLSCVYIVLYVLCQFSCFYTVFVSRAVVILCCCLYCFACLVSVLVFLLSLCPVSLLSCVVVYIVLHGLIVSVLVFLLCFCLVLLLSCVVVYLVLHVLCQFSCFIVFLSCDIVTLC